MIKKFINENKSKITLLIFITTIGIAIKIISIVFKINSNILDLIYPVLLFLSFSIFFGKGKGKGYKDKASYGSHGTSEFMTDNEIKNYYNKFSKSPGFFVGSNIETKYNFNLINKIVVPFESPGENTNCNLIMVGTAGSAKTTGVIIPTILEISKFHSDTDIIITDPKREIIELTKKQLKITHDIYELNFINLSEGNKINLFDSIDSEDDISRTARNIKDSLYISKNETSSYWSEMFYNALMCSIGYYQSQKNANIIAEYNLDDILDSVDPTFYQNNIKNLLEMKGQIALSAKALNEALENSETRANLFSTIFGFLSTIASQNLREKFSKSEVDITLLGKSISDKIDIELNEKNIKDINELNKLNEISKKNYLQNQKILKEEYISQMEKLLIPFEGMEFYDDFKSNKILNKNLVNYSEELEIYEKEEILKVDKKFKKELNQLEKEFIEIRTKIIKMIKEKKSYKIKNKPIAIFISIPVEDRTYAPIINLIVSTILKQLYKNARNCTTGKSLDTRVVLMLEEICTIGKFDFITDMLGTFRALKVYPFFGVQSLAQIKSIYDKKYDEIMGHFNNKIMAGLNDNFTGEEFVKFLGETTIEIDNSSINASKESHSTSTSKTGRSLLFKSELSGYNDKKLILLRKSKKPAEFYKCQFKYWEKEEEGLWK